MKRFSEQLKKRAHSLRLSGAEKHELRERLLSYMEYHPLPASMRTPAAPRHANATAYLRSLVRDLHARRAVGVVAVFLIVGIPVVAERAVPGDVLYPVKVRFNEELTSTLATSPYEKVAWETERIERRLAEARVLADAGKLTPEVEAKVAEAVRTHSAAAQEGIATIREEDSDEAALAEITFSSALAVQSEMLEGKQAEALAGAVDAARDTALAAQQNSRPSFERVLARIEQETTNAHELLSMVEGDATPTERRDVLRRLESVRGVVHDATHLRDEDEAAAIAMLSGALADTRKVISFMTDIDVRTNVSIDALVPVEQTDEEQIEETSGRLAEIATKRAEIETRIAHVDANTRIAAESRLADIESQVTTASSTLAAGELDAAAAAADAALKIVNELITVLDRYDAEMGTSTSSTTTEPEAGS